MLLTFVFNSLFLERWQIASLTVLAPSLIDVCDRDAWLQVGLMDIYTKFNL